MVFCSALHKWSFTLQSYAQHYCEFFGKAMDVAQFAKRLWGNCYFNSVSYTHLTLPTTTTV